MGTEVIELFGRKLRYLNESGDRLLLTICVVKSLLAPAGPHQVVLRIEFLPPDTKSMLSLVVIEHWIRAKEHGTGRQPSVVMENLAHLRSG